MSKNDIVEFKDEPGKYYKIVWVRPSGQHVDLICQETRAYITTVKKEELNILPTWSEQRNQMQRAASILKMAQHGTIAINEDFYDALEILLDQKK